MQGGRLHLVKRQSQLTSLPEGRENGLQRRMAVASLRRWNSTLKEFALPHTACRRPATSSPLRQQKAFLPITHAFLFSQIHQRQTSCRLPLDFSYPPFSAPSARSTRSQRSLAPVSMKRCSLEYFHANDEPCVAILITSPVCCWAAGWDERMCL